MKEGNRFCVPSSSPHISDLEISPAVEGDGGVQEESGLVFPDVVLQIESCINDRFSTQAPSLTTEKEKEKLPYSMCVYVYLPCSRSICPRCRLQGVFHIIRFAFPFRSSSFTTIYIIMIQ